MAIPTQSASNASASVARVAGTQAPIHAPGTRSRAGNAMGRTREAALRGAVRAVAKYGSRKATMGDIAMLAGIAKATLYNHFRTRADVYLAATAAEVDAIAAAALARAGEGFDVALAEAARLVAEHPAVRRVALDEPAVLALLATPGSGPVWTASRGHVEAVLEAGGCPRSPVAVDIVLRYLGSLVLAPCAEPDRMAGARLLHAGLVAVPADIDAAPAVVPPVDTVPDDPTPELPADG